MSNKIKSILLRFLKGAIAGAVVSMGTVTFKQPELWTGFASIGNSLAIAGIYGAVVGLLLALQKWSSWED